MLSKAFEPERIEKIEVRELHEWEGNPVKRGELPYSELKARIEAYGLAGTIAVVPNGKGYIVVDGNRRLKIIKEIGRTSPVMAAIYDRSIDLNELALTLNGYGIAWDLQTAGQVVAQTPEAMEMLPKNWKSALRPMVDLLGDDYAHFITNYAPASYAWGRKAAIYAGKKRDREFIKKAVIWCGKHKMNHMVRRLTDLGVSPKMIETAILKDKSLVMKPAIA